jgi:hypothetical protein
VSAAAAPTADWDFALLVITVHCIALVVLGGRGVGANAAVFGTAPPA